MCKEVIPEDLLSQRQMHEWNSRRDGSNNQAEVIKERDIVRQKLEKYLSLVPIGKSDPYYTIDKKLRIKIFNERGCICEACQEKITDNKFHIHHLNYFEDDDSSRWRVVCLHCHEIINALTGVVAWFQEEITVHQPEDSEEEIPPVTRRVPIEDDPYF